MAFEKPSWLRGTLESGWLNWNRGDWVDWWIITIPPFSFTPGLWIEAAIDWTLGPLNTLWDWIVAAITETTNIWRWILDQGSKVWDWFLNAADWLWGQLTGVFEWVTAFVAQAVRTVRDWFLEAIPGYFADFGKWVWDQLDELDAIWESKWSPLKPIIDFWTYFGKKATDFFNDPVAWFAAVFAAGFELFLQTAGWPFLKVIEAFLVRIWDEED